MSVHDMRVGPCACGAWHTSDETHAVSDTLSIGGCQTERAAWAKIDEEHDTWVDHVRNREETP